MPPKTKPAIIVRVLHTTQGDGLDVYGFFIKGGDIVKVADISRIERDEADELKGFQRPEIRNHVKGIVEYLNQGDVLFPNAIILAMSPEVRFVASRGTKSKGDEGIAQSGTLTIPIYEEGQRVAWIVDGQQRSIALAKAQRCDIAVPVVSFVSNDIAIHREQFILVNKAKPLPTRLINELLPETGDILLPRDLRANKLPAELCLQLNRDPRSPFHKLIKFSSNRKASEAVITDTAVRRMIRRSISNPLGALYPYASSGRDGAEINSMYRVLVTFWSAVKVVFPEAWGKDPRQSRLMHTAGIQAMGVLMDRIYARLSGPDEDVKVVQCEVEKVAPSCRWTKGTWEASGMVWNEVQDTQPHIKKLQEALVRGYTAASSAK